MNMTASRLFAVVFTMPMLAGLVVACGGGDDDGLTNPDLAAGQINCVPFTAVSYEFNTEAVLEVGEKDGTPEADAPPAPPPFTFTEVVEGRVEDGDKAYVHTWSTDGVSNGEFEAVHYPDRGWLNWADSGWTEQDISVRALPFRYRPWDVCNALAPDVNTESLAARESEEVNSVDSTGYSIDGIESDFFAAEPSFGGGSDPANYIDTFEGTVWIADEGAYITRLQMTATGHYPDGTRLTFTMDFEISNVGGDISVDPPDV